MSSACQLVWFRNDLRLHDQPALLAAARGAGMLLPVYVFDPRQFGVTPYGFPKTGGFRARFLLETVADLRRSLQRLGSDLIVRWGYPEKVLPELVSRYRVTAVHATREVTSEEVSAEMRVASAIAQHQAVLRLHWGSTLYAPEDLPFGGPNGLPEIFTDFRKQVEKRSHVRPPALAPRTLPGLPPTVLPGRLPELAEMNLETPPPTTKGVLPFVGGETQALQRLNAYFWERDSLRRYKETRNGLIGPDYSSKFSPWLAVGAISARQIHAEVKRYERERIANDSTYWLIFELIWRDFFRFVAQKHGTTIFRAGGLRGAPTFGAENRELFTHWARGETGFPFIDANMIELASTGWMSNRGRQNVASFLVRDMGVHWRMGAEFFESLLIDYDPCSNWGNWNYVAGVGNDPREDRYFHILKQAGQYDPQGDFVRHWIPALARIPGGRIHEPWRLSGDELRRYGIELGTDYPRRRVELGAGMASR